jgi:hypothetical protein
MPVQLCILPSRPLIHTLHTPLPPASVAAPSSDARQITIFHAAAAGDLELVKFYISGTHGQRASEWPEVERDA